MILLASIPLSSNRQVPAHASVDPMNVLLDRLRNALLPQYEVLEPVSSGGMGVVVLARDPALRRVVAIKVLRPEHATALAAQRFLREARILARLNHPNIITIHHAGEADGLFYYVMDYAGGKSLADHLAEGPLEEGEVRRLAIDLLSGLGAVHREGIVHRDLKPGNILLYPDRAVLGDFGIAQSDQTSSSEADRTEPGTLVGTRAYMAPEQLAGGSVSTETDLYAIGLVLYEATTGSRWVPASAPESGDWSRVPRRWIAPLQRCLALDATKRWPSAEALEAALGSSPRFSSWWRMAAAVAIAALTIVGLYIGIRQPTAIESAALPITLVAFDAMPTLAPLADSITAAVARVLANYPEFRLTLIRPAQTALANSVRVTGSLEAVGDSVRALVRVQNPGLSGHEEITSPLVSGIAWRGLVDSLTQSLLRLLYLGQLSTDARLPRKALPSSPEGLRAWLAAERAYGAAQWEEAYARYLEARTIDTTCLLCDYRLNDVGRWLFSSPSDERQAHLLANLDRFPPHYQALIRAGSISWPLRHDLLEAAAHEFPDFSLAWFRLGDELFHRGPLYGRLSQEAIAPLLMTTQLKPSFTPGWEHLAWAALRNGLDSLARGSLAHLRGIPASAGLPYALSNTLQMGYAWRFGPEAEARKVTDRILSDSMIEATPYLAAGPRVLLTVGSPDGAVYLGGRLAARGPRQELVRSGLLGQLFGYLAAGRLDSATAAAERLARHDPDVETELFLAEWAAARLLILDPSDTRLEESSRATLQRLSALNAAAPLLHQRALWMLAMLPEPPGAPWTVARLGDSLRREHAPPRLVALVEARIAADHGNASAALAQVRRLPSVDVNEPDDLFLDLLLRTRRAEWLERQNQQELARWELRGYEHLQLSTAPTGAPQPGEIDWAFGPALAWRRAQLLDRMGDRSGEICAVYAEVARVWRRGDPPFAVRADSARQRLAQLHCESPS